MTEDPHRSPQSLAEAARHQLEALINSGELMPGDPIDERALAARLGMSRTPVRDAVQQLQVQGLVQVVPRQGVYVARVSIKALLAIFELLAELESVCAKFAARRIDVAGAARLRQALERCEAACAAGDHAAYDQANRAFHQVIYDSASNPFLVDDVLHLRRRTQIYRRDAFQQVGRMAVSLADHRRIAEAICAGRPDEAAAEALAHISVGGKGFADFISALPERLVPTIA